MQFRVMVQGFWNLIFFWKNKYFVHNGQNNIIITLKFSKTDVTDSNDIIDGKFNFWRIFQL